MATNNRLASGLSSSSVGVNLAALNIVLLSPYLAALAQNETRDTKMSKRK